MLARQERPARIRKLIGVIALSIIFSSCYDPPTTSVGSEINSADEKQVEKSSALTESNESDTALSKDVRHVRLTVQNEIPFTPEIYQLLADLGDQLTDNRAEPELILNMRITPERTIRIHENYTEGINEYETELWEHLKTAVSDLLLSSASSDAVVKIQYSSS